MKKKFISIFIGIIIVALGGLVVFDVGLYPVAFIGMHPITKRHLNIGTQAVAHYYITAVKTYGGNIVSLASEAMAKDIRRAALDHAINAILIETELKSRMSRSLVAVREEKLSDILVDSAFKESIPALYGIDFETYKDIFLLPLAEQEILDDRIRLEDNSTVDEWLAEKRKNSTIYLLSPEFSWDNGELITK